MEAWTAAMRGEAPRPSLAIARQPSGSTAAMILAYYASPRAEGFHTLKSASTRDNHRRTLERFAKSKWGPLPFGRLDRLGVERVLADMKDRPGAARNARNVLRRLCKWAKAEGLITVDPTEGVRVTMPETDGFHTMTDAEREQYRERHPIGTKARAAYAVLHFTALRVGDAARLGPQHVRPDPDAPHGVLYLKQQKTREPVTQDAEAEMLEAIAAYPKPVGDNVAPLAFLLNKHGKPFSAKGLSNAVRRWCVEAGLPHCSAHSFRKGTLTLIADRGGTPHQIAARGGHKGLRMVEVYTRKAHQLRLDREAAKLLRDEAATKVSNVATRRDRKAK
jgi:integrase